MNAGSTSKTSLLSSILKENIKNFSLQYLCAANDDVRKIIYAEKLKTFDKQKIYEKCKEKYTALNFQNAVQRQEGIWGESQELLEEACEYGFFAYLDHNRKLFMSEH